MSRTVHPSDDTQLNMVELYPRGENLSVSGNICISATLPTKNPAHGLGSNPDLRPKQPAPVYGLRTVTNIFHHLQFQIFKAGIFQT